MPAWLRSLSVERAVALARPLASGALVRAAALALALAAIAIAIVQFRHDEDAHEVESRPVAADPLAADLARCRTVTPEQLAADDTCRRVWAENRRRFFRPSAPRQPAAPINPGAGVSSTPPKIQDRIPSASSPLEPGEAR
jgi:conjugative transfer region protein TrbK